MTYVSTDGEAAVDPPAWDVLVSYAESDVQWAEWVAWQVEAIGYRVLLQAWDMVPGTHWTGLLADGLARSGRTVAIISSAYVESAQARAEWLEAWRSDREGLQRRLVPVRVEDCRPAGVLGQVVSIDIFGVDADTASMRLADGLHATASGRTKPDAAPMFPGDAAGAWAYPDSRTIAPPFAAVEPPVRPLPAVLPFAQLGSEEFERLTAAVAKHVDGFATVSRYGTRGQRQLGIDVLARNDDESAVCYQAKCYARYMPADLRKAVDEFATRRLSPWRKIIVMVASTTNSVQMLTELERLSTRHTDFAIELRGEEQLSDELRRHPSLVARFFGETWRKEFCLLPEGESATRTPPAIDQSFAPPAVGSSATARPSLEAAVLGELAAGLISPVVALTGMSGAGKSTIARKAVASQEVRDRFADGLIWITAGPGADPTACQSWVLEACGDRFPVRTVDEGVRRLRKVLGGRRVLIVADDVWTAEQVRALDAQVPGSGLLVTSRNAEVVSPGDGLVCVGPLEPDEARNLLARYAGVDADALPDEADDVVTTCGRLALALAIAGGMVADGHQWSYVLARLRNADLRRLRHRFRDYPDHPTLFAALDTSLAALPPADRVRFLELSVFEGQTPVPHEAVRRLWRLSGSLDGLDAADLCVTLAQRSLIQSDPSTATIQVHDLLFVYARHELGARRLCELHHRLAQSFLAGWGGLSEGLPKLAGSPTLDAENAYGLAHVCHHLLRADDPEGLHRLLSSERPGVGADSANLWYHVHERLDVSAWYLADLRLAWQQAEREVDTATERRQRAVSVIREFRYALMTSSVVGIAGQIPVPLLVLLLREGVWTPTEVLAYASSIPNSVVRSQALAALSPNLPGDLVAEVIEGARQMGDPQLRVDLLVQLAPHAPAALLESLFDAVWSTPAWWAQTSGATRLIRFLAPDRRIPVLDSLLDMVRDRDDPLERVWGLDELAPHLTPPLRRRVAAEALCATRDIDDLPIRVSAFALVLAHLPPKRRAVVLVEALTCVDGLSDSYERIDAVAELAPHLAAAGDVPRLRDALAETRATRLTAFGLLRQMIPHLPPELHDDAIAAATAMDDPDALSTALVDLAPHLSARLLASALQAAGTIQSTDSQSNALCGLAKYLPPGLLGEALRITKKIDNLADRCKSLISIAGQLPPHERSVIVDEVLASVPTLDSISVRADVLARLVSSDVDAPLDQVLTLTYSIDDPQERVRILTHLAGAASSPVRDTALAEALAAGREIPEDMYRAKALTDLIPLLPTGYRRQVLLEAVSAARRLNDKASVGQFQISLASCLPPNLIGPALMRTVNEIYVGAERADALATIVRRLPADLLSSALQEARRIPYGMDVVLEALAPRLPPDLLGEALATAWKAPTAHTRISQLVVLAPYTDGAARQRLLDEVLAHDQTKHHRAGVVARLAPLLPDKTRQALLKESEELDPEDRAVALGGLIPTLSDAARTAATENLLGALTTIPDPIRQARSVAMYISLLPAEQHPSLLAATIERIIHESGRYGDQADGLLALAPHLPPDLARKALNAARRLDVPSRQATALAGLTRILVPADKASVLQEAMTATDHVEREKYRVQALEDIARNTVAETVPDVIAKAQTLRYPDDQATVFAELAATRDTLEGPAWPGSWRLALRTAAAAGRGSVLHTLPRAILSTHLSDDTDFVRDVCSLVRDVARCWP
ncbi:NB-ARC domain protein [Parafrankia sp. EUN1f]|nr:NB-ARC domain protein [Parafrankia sp. EUN1f]